MTVIAWDGTSLAADRRACTSYGTISTCTKIQRFQDALIGVSGDWAIGVQIQQWWIEGAIVEKFPSTINKDGSATFIVISPKIVSVKSGRVIQYTTGPYPDTIESPFMAWGGGRDFAIAAMHCGKNAKEAVEIASLYSAYCGNGVDVLAS